MTTEHELNSDDSLTEAEKAEIFIKANLWFNIYLDECEKDEDKEIRDLAEKLRKMSNGDLVMIIFMLLDFRNTFDPETIGLEVN